MTQEKEEEKFPIKLYVYDLSQGLASALSMQFLGIPLEGIWHTSLVAYGVETYYGAGIQQSVPGKTHHGEPLKIIDMGETTVPPTVFKEMLSDLNSVFTADQYDLFEHNCNHMTDQLCQMLLNKSIPSDIRELPSSVLATPMGQMLKPILQQSLKPMVQAPTSNAANIQG